MLLENYEEGSSGVARPLASLVDDPGLWAKLERLLGEEPTVEDLEVFLGDEHLARAQLGNGYFEALRELLEEDDLP